MRTISIALSLLACAGMAVAADPAKAPHKPEAKKAQKAPPAPRMPSLEKLSCRTGPNDHQARLTAVAVKGRPMEFAYYSRLGTSVCSIHAHRGDSYSKWHDENGTGKALIKLLEGTAEFEYKPGYARVKFSDVTRMPYCGMDGELNGTVEVASKNPECVLAGVFD